MSDHVQLLGLEPVFLCQTDSFDHCRASIQMRALPAGPSRQPNGGKIMSQIKVIAYRWVPPPAQGLVRDLRVRWALEEAGLAYEEQLINFGDQSSESHRKLQPFGQIPVYQEGGLTLFESGAIVLQIAERSDALMPSDPGARARVKQWIFSALNTLEPHIQHLVANDLFRATDEWKNVSRPPVEQMVSKRLLELSKRLNGHTFLEGSFTAADLMMSQVLRLLRHTSLVSEIPTLAAYCRRCETRPAFQKALADQMRAFAINAPANA
jgi:glutathione S-transferase